MDKLQVDSKERVPSACLSAHSASLFKVSTLTCRHIQSYRQYQRVLLSPALILVGLSLDTGVGAIDRQQLTGRSCCVAEPAPRFVSRPGRRDICDCFLGSRDSAAKRPLVARHDVVDSGSRPPEHVGCSQRRLFRIHFGAGTKVQATRHAINIIACT